MKFNVSSSQLFANLMVVNRVIASKNSLQILEDALFEIEGDRLIMTASDGETTIRTSIPVEGVEGAGKVATDVKLLIDTFKELPEQPVTFAIDDNNLGIKVSSVNGTYSFVGENGNEFPQMPALGEGAQRCAMPAAELLQAMERTLFCAADDELRPVMNGIYFDLSPEAATIVATDAHRLVRLINKNMHVSEAAAFILPKKPAALLKTVLAKVEEDVQVSFDAKNVRFEFAQTVIICRQIEGRYPNYNAVIPQNNSNRVTVDKATIVNACKRVAVFANTGTSLLKLALGENKITISAQDIDFSKSAEETVACSYEGTPMAIGFKAAFLTDILAAVPCEQVVIELADPARAGLILPADNEENQELLMLIMPMLLND